VIGRKVQEMRQPRTLVGQWLLAGILDQRDLRDRLGKALNRGQRGWNNDEPAVVEAVCQIASRMLFPTGADGGQVAAFAIRMRELIPARDPHASPAGQEETEAVIHAALEDAGGDLSRFRKSAVFQARGAVIAAACSKLGLTDEAITQMIVDGEQIALQRGWHPPLRNDEAR
jgi:hypothetical protein